MKRLQATKHLLYTLHKADPKFRRIIVKNAPDEVIRAIRDICYNILASNHQVCPRKLKQLKKYKAIIRKISRPQSKVASTRRVLVQHGGGLLPILIGTVLSLLANL